MAAKRLPPNIFDMPRFRIVIVGDGGVGKSALTIQYFQKMFVECHNPTIEDSYIQNDIIDDDWCILDVLDTAGQEEFSAMREQYMRKGQGFIIVYSVTDRQGFNDVRRFHTQILRCKDRDTYPMILAANKIDLVHHRKVTQEEGRHLATELKVDYIETSAKNPPINVDAMFHELIRIIKRANIEDTAICPKDERKKINCSVL